MTNGDVLNSWKEIATYVGRGVRTVQRWEQELHLPVRRPRGKHRSAVIALKQDIDLWLRTPHAEKGVHRTPARHISPDEHARLLRNTEALRARTTALLESSDRVRRQVDRALEIAKLKNGTHAIRAGVEKAKAAVAALQEGGGTIQRLKPTRLTFPAASPRLTNQSGESRSGNP